MNSKGKPKSPTNNGVKSSTNLDDDDWDTDPDFIRDMDEMDQRWGSKRTVGSINMSKLIDEVHNDHKTIMKERFMHPSRTTAGSTMSSSSSTSKKIITTSSSSNIINDNSRSSNLHEQPPISTSATRSVNDMKKTLFEKANNSDYNSKAGLKSNNTIPANQKSSYMKDTDFVDRLNRFQLADQGNKSSEETTIKKIYSEHSRDGGTTSTTSSRIVNRLPREPVLTKSSEFTKNLHNQQATRPKPKPTEILEDLADNDVPKAFDCIQKKIQAYKKELEELENEVTKKAEMAKSIKKSSSSTTSFADKKKSHEEDSSNIEYVDRREKNFSSSSTSKTSANQEIPIKDNIRSLREKFDSLVQEDELNFREQTEARRKEFFDEIKNQVRETRRGLDGFDDPIEEEFEDLKRRFLERTAANRRMNSPTSPTKLDIKNSQSSLMGGSPKIYTQRETHREEVVSKIVKKNDQVIENETKRNVEHSSSHHGSSDEEVDSHVRARDVPIEVERHQDQQKAPLNKSTTNSNNSANNNSRTKSPISGGSSRTQSPVGGGILQTKRQDPIIKSSMKGAGLMARTLYDYEAVEPDELSFDVDDLITNIEKIDVGWYKGIMTFKDGKKREGLFPANYVKLLNDDGEF